MDSAAQRTIARMAAHYESPALESPNKPFALLYLRTTEGMRDANHAGEFSDPHFWADQVIPTFAGYYLDAYAAWKRGDHHIVDPAWRIAFEVAPGTVSCTQQLYLGINAHVRNDLAFMIEVLGERYRYPDHKPSTWPTPCNRPPGLLLTRTATAVAGPPVGHQPRQSRRPSMMSTTCCHQPAS